MAKVSTKEVLQGDGWIITKVTRGYNGKVRINAKRRFYKADSQNLFCEWVTLKYANRCRRDADKKYLKITHY